jgi:hypothetical protein
VIEQADEQDASSIRPLLSGLKCCPQSGVEFRSRDCAQNVKTSRNRAACTAYARRIEDARSV